MTFLRRWWPILVIAVGVLVGVWYLNGLRDRASEAERERDEAKLELAGANVAHQSTKAELLAEVARLTTANAGLVAEINRILGAMPDAKPAGTMSGGTGPMVLKPPTLQPTDPTDSACASAPTCLLAATDKIEVKVDAVTMRGSSGAVAVAATAQVWKLSEPPTLLAEGPLKLDIKVPTPPGPPGWGVGPAVFAGRWGWAAGVALGTPPLRVLGVQVDVVAGVGLGPNGEWSGAIMAPIRW